MIVVGCLCAAAIVVSARMQLRVCRAAFVVCHMISHLRTCAQCEYYGGDLPRCCHSLLFVYAQLRIYHAALLWSISTCYIYVLCAYYEALIFFLAIRQCAA